MGIESYALNVHCILRLNRNELLASGTNKKKKKQIKERKKKEIGLHFSFVRSNRNISNSCKYTKKINEIIREVGEDIAL